MTATRSRENVLLTAKLIQTREALQFLHRQHYPERVAPYRKLIASVAKTDRISVLSAALRLGVLEDDLRAMWLIAAAVDEIEGVGQAVRQ
jgi:hypothetical protein